MISLHYPIRLYLRMHFMLRASKAEAFHQRYSRKVLREQSINRKGT
uniref:Uncharacterized protein n=1 Tax=Physcomitrium patens TaxID=3218 RepID=A0A2K1J1J8_PHYPA|nr:hypothetical protein PHYPA_023297 [Physcomitrium patens]